MTTPTRVFLSVLALLAAAAGGYWVGRVGSTSGAPPGPVESAADAKAVATVGREPITAGQLRARMAELGPMAKARLTTAEGKRELLQELLRTELLSQAARRQGMDRERAVRRALDEALAEAYLARTLEPKRATVDVPEAEVRARYEQRKAELSRPERVKVAHIFLSAPEEPAARRAQRQAEANQLLAEVKRALSKDFYGFAPLAQAKSEDPESKAKGGELPPLTREELVRKAGPEVAEAAFAMTAPNQLLDRVVATRAGFHVLRLLDREPAQEPTFEQVRESLRARLKQEKQEAMYQALLASLREETPVRVDDAALDAVTP